MYNIGFWLPVAIIVGLLVAFIATGAMRSELKSVVRQSGASNYIREGSLKLSVRTDTFLYKEVEKTPRQQVKADASPTIAAGGARGGVRPGNPMGNQTGNRMGNGGRH